MKLHFLGQVYATSNNQIETEILPQTGRFLGQNYRLRRPVKIVKPQLGLKYRGVVYGKWVKRILARNKAELANIKKLNHKLASPKTLKSGRGLFFIQQDYQ